MKLIYDNGRIQEGIERKAYDERGLAISKSGKHRYPSKKMFIDFLRQFKDIRGMADIWSEENWDTDEVTIHVELRYKVANQ